MSRPVGRPITKPCGTPDSTAAYKRHIRLGEEPCDDCKAEWAKWHRENYARKKGLKR